jgi:DNA ligase-associated metallophosphoesterase
LVFNNTETIDKLAQEKIQLKGQTLLLQSDRTLYWENEQALLLADLHLGKAGHFKSQGVYVPGTIINQELIRLKHAIESTSPKTIYLLGDLFHAGYNEEWPLFASFVAEYPSICWVLVKGNHDRLSLPTYIKANLEVQENTLEKFPFLFAHKPEHLPTDSTELIGICGHIHPGFVLSVKGVMGSVRLPCLWMNKGNLVLPAFGSFTGLDIIKPQKEDQVWLLGKENIWNLKF